MNIQNWIKSEYAIIVLPSFLSSGGCLIPLWRRVAAWLWFPCRYSITLLIRVQNFVIQLYFFISCYILYLTRVPLLSVCLSFYLFPHWNSNHHFDINSILSNTYPSCIPLPDMLYLRYKKSNRPQGVDLVRKVIIEYHPNSPKFRGGFLCLNTLSDKRKYECQ